MVPPFSGAVMIIKSLLDFPGYGVSADGRVWTKRMPGHKNKRRDDWTPLYGHVERDGYVVVNLQGKSRGVHRLVVSAFIGPIPIGRVVNHIDGDPGNNALVNLEVVTPQQNMAHAARRGKFSGVNNGMAKLCAEDVQCIRRLINWGFTQAAVAERYGVTRFAIADCGNGRHWRHI